MKVIFAYCALLFATVAHSAPVNEDNPWALFKQVHGKQYISVEEESAR